MQEVYAAASDSTHNIMIKQLPVSASLHQHQRVMAALRDGLNTQCRLAHEHRGNPVVHCSLVGVGKDT